MSEPRVILVGGLLTSGKDAFADHLVAKHGFKKLGMSDTLAEALYRLNPLIPVKLLGFIPWSRRYQVIVDKVGYVEAKKIPEVRRLLQVLGTEVGRELLGKNIWVEAALNMILEQTDAGHDVVITGIRFPNELDIQHMLIEMHGVPADLVWVERPEATKKHLEALAAAGETHSSEGSVEVRNFNYAIQNSGTLEDLYGQADRFLEYLGEWH